MSIPRKVLCLWLGLTRLARHRQGGGKDCTYSSLQGFDWPVIVPCTTPAHVCLRTIFSITVDLYRTVNFSHCSGSGYMLFACPQYQPVRLSNLLVVSVT